MIGTATGRARRRRYRSIGSVLTRHGMGTFTTGLGLGFLVPFHWGLLGHQRRRTPYTMAEHIRLALEELGPAAIKVGQVISTRPDLVPPEVATELEALRDRVPPVPTDQILEVVEQELGGRSDQVFAEFDPIPLAGASIGQVHAARLIDGTAVAVKVRKPGVAEEVITDLDILARLAARIAAGDADHAYDLGDLAGEFAWTLRSEIDYRTEARNAERLRAVLAAEPRAVVPAIFHEVSTGGVLVMERLTGVRLDDPAAVSTSGMEPREVARAHAEILLRQVFEAGVFHADPHPGNFLLLDDGRIGLLDFGMVGRLDDRTQRAFTRMLLGTARQDAGAMTDALESLGVIRHPSLAEGVRRDLHRMLDRYYGLAVDQFSIRGYLEDLLGVVRRRRLQLPSDLALLLKTVAMSDGLWRRLDPTFNAYPIGEDYARRLATRLYSPGHLARRAAEEATRLLEGGPSARRPAVGSDDWERIVALLGRQVRAGAAQAGRAMAAAGLAVAIALLTLTYQPPGWRLVAPALIYGGAAVVVYLTVRILIARRRP